jgi:single-strand DNA-binding protein
MSQRDSHAPPIRTSTLRRIPHLQTERCTARGRFLRPSLVRVAHRRFSIVQWGVGAARKPLAMRSMKRWSSVSLPCLSGHTLRAFSGAWRHVAALLSGLLSQNEFGPLLQKARLGTWEPGLSLGLRQGVTRPIREFNNGELTMYQNRITLIRFLGKDATAVTTTNANFTALSLATKSSYKDKATGKYIDHTEWHRCIVWGKLAEYAKTLKKGAHLSVEGELRSRERVDKKTGQNERVWEVRVASILKLDRAEKVSPEEQADDHLNPEEEAA